MTHAVIVRTPPKEAGGKLYASVGFEEVPEAYDAEDDEMPAVLKL